MMIQININIVVCPLLIVKSAPLKSPIRSQADNALRIKSSSTTVEEVDPTIMIEHRLPTISDLFSNLTKITAALCTLQNKVLKANRQRPIGDWTVMLGVLRGFQQIRVTLSKGRHKKKSIFFRKKSLTMGGQGSRILDLWKYALFKELLRSIFPLCES